jgi:hypothetical protein
MSPVRKREGWLGHRKLGRLLAGAMVVPVVLALVAGGFLAWNLYHSVYAQPARYAPPPAQNFRAARKVFPFSVIPGGVYEPRELVASMEKDPALREHYKDVKLDNLVAVRTSSPIKAEVSYRKNGCILWSSKAVTIPAGELVLTDGKNMIRGRCGNRMRIPKETARSGVATTETEEVAFDVPLPPLEPPAPPYQPVVPPGVHPPDVVPTPQETTTPEPGTLLLFASGMLFLGIWVVPRQ